MSDQMSDPAAPPTGLGADVTTNEQERVEQAGEAAAKGHRFQVFGRHELLSVLLRNVGLVIVLLVLALIGKLTSDNFLTGDNVRNILVSSSVIGVVTVGMTFVIIGGGIDLSVGALVALASVWATTVATQAYGPAVMIACALLVGAGAGLVNGLLIAYGRLVPFIVTLAMLVSARGLSAKLADNRTQIVESDRIKNIAITDVFGVPLLVLILAVVVAAGWVLLNRTTFGRRTFAIGGNAEAARLAGIDVTPAHRAALRAVRTVLRHRRGDAPRPHDHRLEHPRQPLRARRDRRGDHRRHAAHRRPRHHRSARSSACWSSPPSPTSSSSTTWRPRSRTSPRA